MKVIRLLSLVVLCLLARSGWAQIVNFKTHSYFNSLSSSDKIEQGDLNKDGVIDFVVASEYGIVIFLNHNGQPAETSNYYGRYNGGTIAVGDFDKDSDLDIACVNYDSLYILKNSGSGTFSTSKAALYLGVRTLEIMSTDLNNDGRADLVTGNFFVSTISIYLSSTSSSTGFEPPIVYNTGLPIKISHGDFDNNTFEDVVVMNSGQNSFTIFFNKGNGTFSDGVSYAAPHGAGSVVVADVDGDSILDMVVGGGDGTTAYLQVFKNSGTTFSLLQSFPITMDFLPREFLSSGDFNQDNAVDLICLDWTKGFAYIKFNDGAGNFNSQITIATRQQPNSVNTGDYNSDGRTDWVIGNFSTLQTGFNDGNATFHYSYSAAGYPTGVTSGDFNNDGKPDVVTTNYNDGTLSAMMNDGTGKFPVKQEFQAVKKTSKVASANWIGDANLDLVAIDADNDSLVLLTGKGDGTFLLSKKYKVPGAPLDIVVSDFNQDGKMDVATAGTPISLLLNNGDGFDPPTAVRAAFNSNRIAAGDLNGDQLPDIVIAAYNAPPYVLWNKDGRSFSDPVGLFDAYTNWAYAVSIADFTFDGILDIGFTSDSYLIVLKNDGKGNFTTSTLFNGIYTATHIVASDFTGDGKQDVAVAIGGAISVLVANGNNGYFDAVTFRYPDLFDLTAANFDGDDKTDIAISGWPYHYLSILTSLPHLGVTVGNYTREYGLPNPEFQSTVEGWPGPGNLNITYQTMATINSSIGNYDIVPIVADSIVQNFALVKKSGVLSITPAPLTITAKDTVRRVGAENPVFRATVVGLRNNNYLPFELYSPADVDSRPGQYPIYPFVTSGANPNYSVTLINGTLTIVADIISPPFPNPSDGNFKIYSLTKVNFKIVNSVGEVVDAGTLLPGENQLQVKATPGFYVLVTENGDKQKLMII